MLDAGTDAEESSKHLKVAQKLDSSTSFMKLPLGALGLPCILTDFTRHILAVDEVLTAILVVAARSFIFIYSHLATVCASHDRTQLRHAQK